MFSRRLLSRLSFLVVSALSVLLLAACGSSGGGGGGSKSPSDVNDVGTIAATSMGVSGASIVPNNLKAAMDVLNNATSDPVLTDIQTALGGSSTSSTSGSTLKARTVLLAGSALNRTFLGLGSVIRRDVGTDAQAQLDKIHTDLQGLPHSKSLNDTIDVSKNDLGSYLYLTTGTGSLTISLKTTNNADLDTSAWSNFKSASGDASLSIVMDPKALPSTSVIKDIHAKMNAGASVTIGNVTVSPDGTTPKNVGFDYGESTVLALSILESGGNGGKFVLTANAKNSGNIPDTSVLKSGDYSTLAPQISVTLAVYNDAGTQTFSQTWTDINQFMSDAGSSTGGSAPAPAPVAPAP